MPRLTSRLSWVIALGFFGGCVLNPQPDLPTSNESDGGTNASGGSNVNVPGTAGKATGDAGAGSDPSLGGQGPSGAGGAGSAEAGSTGAGGDDNAGGEQGQGGAGGAAGEAGSAGESALGNGGHD